MWPHILAGLITEVTEEQQIALVEYIAHLTCEDWVAVSNDLVALGGWPCQTTSWLQVGGRVKRPRGFGWGGGIGRQTQTRTRTLLRGLVCCWWARDREAD